MGDDGTKVSTQTQTRDVAITWADLPGHLENNRLLFKATLQKIYVTL